MTEKNVTTIQTAPTIEDAPLSLRGGRKQIIKGDNTDDIELASLASCADAISTAALKIESSCRTILRNELQPPIKNASDARNTAVKIFQGIAPKLDSTRKRTEAAIAQLESSTQPPKPKDALGAVLASECRSAVARLPQSERAKVINQAINDGDDAFVAALVGASPILSGLGKAEQAALLDGWKRQRHGRTLDRIERLKVALAETDRLSSLLSSYAFGVCAEQNAAITAAQESERLARAAMREAVAGPSSTPSWS